MVHHSILEVSQEDFWVGYPVVVSYVNPDKPQWELHLIDVLGKEGDLLTIVFYVDNFVQLFLQINFLWRTMSFRVFSKS